MTVHDVGRKVFLRNFHDQNQVVVYVFIASEPALQDRQVVGPLLVLRPPIEAELAAGWCVPAQDTDDVLLVQRFAVEIPRCNLALKLTPILHQLQHNLLFFRLFVQGNQN